MRDSVQVSGHVFLREAPRGSRWYAKYRLPDGRQVQKVIGPAWQGKGRPAEGHHTRRTATAWLEVTLADLRRQTVVPVAVSDERVTFAEAAAEWLRHAEHERGVRASTLREYRSALEANLLPAFGSQRIDRITTPLIDRWVRTQLAEGRLSRRTISKLLTMLNGIFNRARKAFGLAVNPAADVDRPPERYSGDFEVYSPEEVRALARAAASELDAALFVTAAFTGLRRGELLGLRWRDVDFGGSAIRVRASVVRGEVAPPKSGRVRSVPMVPEVAEHLTRLAERPFCTGQDDLVFTLLGEHLDGSAAVRRFKVARDRAGLRPLRFHDLRHTFGSLAINRASIVQVQHWLGHSDVKTTMRYLHHKSREDEAALLEAAFGTPSDGQIPGAC